MIIFSLRSFKGCQDRYLRILDEAPPPGRKYVRGYLSSASGLTKVSKPDANVEIMSEVTITAPRELFPMNEASAAWLRELLLEEGTNGHR